MLISLIVIAVGFVMIAVERVRPGRKWPDVPTWWVRAILLNAVQVAMVFAAGSLWNGWMRQHRPWSLDALGIVPGAAVGYLVITFIFYWWHRWRHEVGFFWRWLHQVHHSPQRIEIITGFYKHPLEQFINGVISSAVLYLVVGLDASAAALAVLFIGLAELFYHWNISTPRWIGYIIQRPESHCVHHQVGIHAYNYSDLPLWDILFGTFKNPTKFEAQCGFPDHEHKIVDMLCGREQQPWTQDPAGSPGPSKHNP